MNFISRQIMLFLIVLMMGLWLSIDALKSVQAVDENAVVRLPKQEWQVTGDEDEEYRKSLREAVVAWQQAWIERDIKTCRDMLAAQVLMVSQNQARILSGREAVLKALPREWAYYETDDQGASALQSTLRRVRAEVRGNAALIHYYMDVTGGNRWAFDDTAAFTQIFIRDEDDEWRLAFSADVWNLDYDAESGKGGQPVFTYDYALPVNNLTRAVKFYQPLLGEPEALTKDLAVFEMKESRLYLVTAEKGGKLARARQGLPNGWAILTSPNIEKVKENSEKQGVEFIETEQDFAGMKILYGYEPSGNLIALVSAATSSSAVKQPVLQIAEAMTGDKLSAAILNRDKDLWTTWLHGATDKFMDQCVSDIVLLDATRTRTQGWAIGEKNVRKRLLRTFGDAADGEVQQSWQGRQALAKLSLMEGHTRQIGEWAIIVRQVVGTGVAPWQRRLEALDTRIFTAKTAQLAVSLTVSAAVSRGIALEFDYAGIPATKSGWKATDNALRALTGGADSYHDEQWKGFWGGRAVLGMFETDVATDKMPRNQEASTYLSLLVNNIEAAMKHIEAAGATFPVIPAINDEAGVSKHPGYRQVLFTDSEGNALVLTAYTGRSKR